MGEHLSKAMKVAEKSMNRKLNNYAKSKTLKELDNQMLLLETIKEKYYREK